MPMSLQHNMVSRRNKDTKVSKEADRPTEKLIGTKI